MGEQVKAEVEQHAVEILDWLKGVAQEGEGFVREQAPLVAQEIVAWEFWGNVAAAAIACFMATAVFVGALLLCRAAEKWADPAAEELCVAISVSVVAIALIASCVIVPGSLYGAAKAAVAPRVVILEYVTGR